VPNQAALFAVQESFSMHELAHFFKTPPTSLGVFYPKDYAIISFRSYSVAEEVAKALLAHGWPEKAVRFISPKELLEFLDDLDSTLTGMVMTAVSRMADTEGANALLNAQRAKEGAGFVAVHCSTESEALSVLAFVRPWEPMSMDYYIRGGVEELVSSAEPAAMVAQHPDYPALKPFRRDSTD
jgi:hypothetical protein